MRLRWIAVAAGAGLVVAAALHSGALVLATLAAAALAALVVVSRRNVFRGLSFARTPAQRVVPWGGQLEVTLSLSNAKLMPVVWLRLWDEWPSGLEPHGFVLQPSAVKRRQRLSQTLSLRWYERVRRRYRVTCTQRGLHRFGPAELEAGDPFGVSGVAREVTDAKEIVVLPRVLDVPDLEVLVGRPLLQAPTTRSLALDPTALRGTRPYQAGDPPRAVNWRATARTAVLHSNEYDPTMLGEVKLLLDVGVYEHAWTGVDPDRVELLCVVAASFATAYAARGFRVGLASNARLEGDRRTVDIQPSEAALDDVLETLGRVFVYPADDFSGVLTAELCADMTDTGCLLIVPALRPRPRELVGHLRQERPTAVVYVGCPAPDEQGLTDAVVAGDFDWRRSDALALAV
jgi:uncharacterized protein (DUF58 family)